METSAADTLGVFGFVAIPFASSANALLEALENQILEAVLH